MKVFSSIGENIVLFRKAHNYTQQRLAHILGMERSTLAKMETGTINGSIENLVRFSALSGIPLDSLLGIRTDTRFCIDMAPELKKDFYKLCQENGIPPETAFKLFAQEAVKQQALPFEMKNR